MLSHPGPITVTVTVAAAGPGVSSDAYSGSSAATAGDGRHLQSPDLEPASESVIEHTVLSHPVTVTVTVAAAGPSSSPESSWQCLRFQFRLLRGSFP